ncbi:3-isopropylmalate dehydratase small subunit [Candidatus Persebacteraceae bacterium Df01]|jgi:3-isopropylmalate/(R)-2-methylmalate dehydratase small subunit|uniref:3-isopropylmalate dehydratase small subunit n=1 Tax=Candidatus Doriopsillibacter californiensis TaxID=2970740 RepID=A0ABT7QMI7_9GAMM|nr:3-isopropylmalate dehydratase small subunit [Candidatus Persebacteraceae bacterium Df01]
MQRFNTITSVTVPLDYPNVDTDQIIPKQFLRSIKRSGFGPYLFDEWRYLDRGELGMDCSSRPKNPDFILNDSRYVGAKILLTRDNFGCGSSREHAVWALMDAGFCAVIGPSFGDIFSGNAVKNGLLTVVLPDDDMELLFASAGESVTIDLATQTVTANNNVYRFNITNDDKKRLLNGLDDIAITLQHADAIRDYESQRYTEEPWLTLGSKQLP